MNHRPEAELAMAPNVVLALEPPPLRDVHHVFGELIR